MFFRVVQPSRDAFGFQVVLADGRVALSSVPFADRAAALRAIHVVIACLREGVDASLDVDGDLYRCSIRGLDGAVLAVGASHPSPTEVDAQLADILHWVATVERFRVEEPLQASPSAVGYDLEPRERPRAPGLDLLEPTRARLFSARIHDARGEPLLYTPGFPTRFGRDEHVEALLAALPDPRRYDRRDDEGRHYAVVTTKNGRELARSRWYADPADLDAALAWLTALAPDELLANARREGGAAGFEGYRGAGGQHFFRLLDERGEPLFSSHGYASAKARDNGIRSLLKAATDPTCYRLGTDGGSFTISALNGRQLVHSREFASFEEIERATAWVRREVLRLGKACGIRLWDSMIIELPHDIDDTNILTAPSAAEEVVDRPLRALGVDVIMPADETTSLVIEAPLAESIEPHFEPQAEAPALAPTASELAAPVKDVPVAPDDLAGDATNVLPEPPPFAESSASAAEPPVEPGVPLEPLDVTAPENLEPVASPVDVAASEPTVTPDVEPVTTATSPVDVAAPEPTVTPDVEPVTTATSPVDVASTEPTVTPDVEPVTTAASPVDVAPTEPTVTPDVEPVTTAASPVDVAASEPTVTPDAEPTVTAAASPVDVAPAGPPESPRVVAAPEQPATSGPAPAALERPAPLEPAPPRHAPSSPREPTSPEPTSTRELPVDATPPAAEPTQTREHPVDATSSAAAETRSTAPAKLVTIAMPRRTTLPGVPRHEAPKFNAPGQPRPLDAPEPGTPRPRASRPHTAPERSKGHAVARHPERSQSHTRAPTSIAPRPPERSQPHARPRAEAPAPEPLRPLAPPAPTHEPPQPTSGRPLAPPAPTHEPQPTSGRPLAPPTPTHEPQPTSGRPLAPTPSVSHEPPPQLTPERPLAPLPQPEPTSPDATDVPQAPVLQRKKRRPRLSTAERAALGGSRSGEIVDQAAGDAPRPSASGSASIVLHPRSSRDDAGASATNVPSDMSSESVSRRETRPEPAASRSLPVLIPPGLDAPAAAAPPAPTTRPKQPAAPPVKPGDRNAGLRVIGGALLLLAVVALVLFAVRDRGRADRHARDDASRTPPPEAKQTPTPTPPPQEPPRPPELAQAEPPPIPEHPPVVEEPPAQPQPTPGGCPADGADDPAIGVLVSPASPVAGKPLRVLAATFADEQPISLQILAADETPITEAVDLRARAGLPASTLATWTPPTAGDFRVRITAGAAHVCRPLRVDERRRRSGARLGPTVVWPVERAWTPGEEALFSAWVRDLFAASDDPGASLGRLDRLLGDPARNVLHGALGLGEDRRDGVRLRPDDDDLAYSLRAYWAWKRRLPFAFRKCTDPRSGQPQQCDAPRSNLSAGRRVPKRDGELDRARRFLQRTLPASISAGNARIAHDDADNDLYPVQIDRRALRPGTLYVDPRGQVLVVVELAGAQDGTPGALHVVGARFDGALARRRFSEGTVVWHPDPQLGGTGFKRFRPVDDGDGGVFEWSDQAIMESADHADLWTGQAELDARAFHDKVAGLIDPPPWDPAVVQREAAAALLELVQERVVAVERGAARAARSRRPIDMPRGLALFDATGAWEEFATPGADLRLLGALDVVRAIPDRVRDQPGLFALSGDAAAVADALDAGLDAALRAYPFTYLRSDGSEWQLSLADLAARSAELERAYNPNDCPERRWGAPEGSDEAATCTFRAPAEQQERMEQNRDWFRVRRSAARRPR